MTSRVKHPNWDYVRANDYESRGCYNPPTVIKVVVNRKPIRVKISPGRSDLIDVSAQGDWLFVSCLNTRLTYLGCEVFNFSGQLVADFFAHGSEQCADVFSQEMDDEGNAPWEGWSLRYLWSQIRRYASEIAGNT